jgi:aristolochene synthase
MHQFKRIHILKRVTSGRNLEVPILTTNCQFLSRHAYLANKPTRRYSTIPNFPCEIPACQLEFKTHPLGWQKIQTQIEPYFGNNWNFASEKEKKGFLAIGFSRAFSRFFPLTLDDRIESTCKVFYLTLLIDGWFLERKFETGYY